MGTSKSGPTIVRFWSWYSLQNDQEQITHWFHHDCCCHCHTSLSYILHAIVIITILHYHYIINYASLISSFGYFMNVIISQVVSCNSLISIQKMPRSFAGRTPNSNSGNSHIFLEICLQVTNTACYCGQPLQSLGATYLCFPATFQAWWNHSKFATDISYPWSLHAGAVDMLCSQGTTVGTLMNQATTSTPEQLRESPRNLHTPKLP